MIVALCIITILATSAVFGVLAIWYLADKRMALTEITVSKEIENIKVVTRKEFHEFKAQLETVNNKLAVMGLDGKKRL